MKKLTVHRDVHSIRWVMVSAIKLAYLMPADKMREIKTLLVQKDLEDGHLDLGVLADGHMDVVDLADGELVVFVRLKPFSRARLRIIQTSRPELEPCGVLINSIIIPCWFILFFISYGLRYDWYNLKL